ncbi:hypothetical protein CC86DRAFT_411564 [Ophiobolus disseminans]|uniref:F-box domain-containing protein n=1 Tax=Ophiobolus disseminans TaxID=1469910 RepID=A0A6A6ZLZ8_9PLEO|nr:hypothetical protein CC86DRAFT_411564 [Ophiobolus disseminans]
MANISSLTDELLLVVTANLAEDEYILQSLSLSSKQLNRVAKQQLYTMTVDTGDVSMETLKTDAMVAIEAVEEPVENRLTAWNKTIASGYLSCLAGVALALVPNLKALYIAPWVGQPIATDPLVALFGYSVPPSWTLAGFQ